jgi:hypothetical protein
MIVPQPTVKPIIPTPYYTYFFFGTVEREFNCSEWMVVKVGVANDVHRRLRSYKTHCPVPFHTGLKVKCLDIEQAKKLESAILEDENLKDYRSQGEWFTVAGMHQHMIFIKNLLGCFYVERYRNPSLWNSRLEWVILPNEIRVAEIADADKDFFCGIEAGEKNINDVFGDESELNRRVKAQEQAESLIRIVYPNFEG